MIAPEHSNHMKSGVKLTTKELVELRRRLTQGGVMCYLSTNSQHPPGSYVVAWARSRTGEHRTLSVPMKKQTGKE